MDNVLEKTIRIAENEGIQVELPFEGDPVLHVLNAIEQGGGGGGGGGTTKKIQVSSPTTESITGTAVTQQDVNNSVVSELSVSLSSKGTILFTPTPPFRHQSTDIFIHKGTIVNIPEKNTAKGTCKAHVVTVTENILIPIPAGGTGQFLVFLYAASPTVSQASAFVVRAENVKIHVTKPTSDTSSAIVWMNAEAEELTRITPSGDASPCVFLGLLNTSLSYSLNTTFTPTHTNTCRALNAILYSFNLPAYTGVSRFAGGVMRPVLRLSSFNADAQGAGVDTPITTTIPVRFSEARLIILVSLTGIVVTPDADIRPIAFMSTMSQTPPVYAHAVYFNRAQNMFSFVCRVQNLVKVSLTIEFVTTQYD